MAATAYTWQEILHGFFLRKHSKENASAFFLGKKFALLLNVDSDLENMVLGLREKTKLCKKNRAFGEMR